MPSRLPLPHTQPSLRSAPLAPLSGSPAGLLSLQLHPALLVPAALRGLQAHCVSNWLLHCSGPELCFRLLGFTCRAGSQSPLVCGVCRGETLAKVFEMATETLVQKNWGHTPKKEVLPCAVSKLREWRKHSGGRRGCMGPAGVAEQEGRLNMLRTERQSQEGGGLLRAGGNSAPAASGFPHTQMHGCT